MTKNKKQLELEQKMAEITDDLKRTRADFENYRKRADIDKAQARELGQTATILKLLPVIDNIERAITFMPEELKDNTWVQGVAGLVNSLEKSLESMDLKRIDASVGTLFNPELHDAVQFDEDAKGDSEIISEQLQAGYTLGGRPIRHAMVRVTRQ